MNIHLDTSVRDFLGQHPETLPVFRTFGFQDFDNQVKRERLGPFLKLRTLLKHRGVDVDAFLGRCAEAIEEDALNAPAPAVDLYRERPTLLALLPCGLKVSVDRALQALAEDFEAKGAPLAYLAEGNVNHELSYYPYIDSVESADELPDIILSADLNAFFHQRFLQRFVLTGGFESVEAGMNQRLGAVGFSDPRGCFTPFCANPLVLVYVKDVDLDIPAPEAFEDLLEPAYERSLIMRGQGDFFCSGVLLPFYRLFGRDAVVRLARRVRQGMHPSQMVKMIDGRAANTPPLFIMPWFFAQKIKARDRVEIIFPREGAFISPVQLLVKRDRRKHLRAVTDFLMGEALHQQCSQNFFPSPHPSVPDGVPEGKKLFWIGWDFIYQNDLETLKKEVGQAFTAAYREGGVPQCA